MTKGSGRRHLHAMSRSFQRLLRLQKSIDAIHENVLVHDDPVSDSSSNGNEKHSAQTIQGLGLVVA
jgi:predicted metal-dependent HD superfamily phosphohydrolase